MCISGTLSMHIFVPALPAAARDLGVDSGTIQLTLTLYLVGISAGQLFWGPLSDRVGRRPALLGGLFLYFLGSAAAGLAPGVWPLIGARVVQALGGCSGLVLGRAVLRDVSPPREAAAQLAMLNLFMSISPAMAPMVGGLLASLVSWRMIFVLLAAIGLVTLLATWRTLPETNPHRSGSGVLRGYARLLSLPEFRAFAIGGACSTTSFFAFLAAAPFIFADRLHRPPAEIGFYFVVPILGISIGSILANRCVRRIEPIRIMVASSLVATCGAALFMGLEASDRLSVIGVLLPILVFTIGCGTVSPLALTSAISVQPNIVGAASGLYGFIQMGWGAICTLLVSQWEHNPAEGAAIVLLGSNLVGLTAILLAARRKPA